MKTDPDFSRCQLKANASGSWMNVCHFKSEQWDEVRAACLVLVKAAGERKLHFKILDAAGGQLAILGSNREWKDS